MNREQLRARFSCLVIQMENSWQLVHLLIITVNYYEYVLFPGIFLYNEIADAIVVIPYHCTMYRTSRFQ